MGVRENEGLHPIYKAKFEFVRCAFSGVRHALHPHRSSHFAKRVIFHLVHNPCQCAPCVLTRARILKTFSSIKKMAMELELFNLDFNLHTKFEK